MLNYFHEAGWGIYPTLLFGLLSFIGAIYYLINPRRDILVFVIGFTIGTILSSFLSATTGIQNTSRFVVEKAKEAERFTMYMTGLRESLNNVTVGLILATLNSILVTIGCYRVTKKEK